MDWDKRNPELDESARRGRPGVEKELERLLPVRHRRPKITEDRSAPLASDSSRKANAITKANVEKWRSRAYQVNWRAQLR